MNLVFRLWDPIKSFTAIELNSNTLLSRSFNFKSTALVLAAFVLGTAASPLAATVEGPSSAGRGTSNYFVQGMSDPDQAATSSSSTMMASKWFFCGWATNLATTHVSRAESVPPVCLTSRPPSRPPALSKYDWQTLDLLDKTLTLSKHGIKVLISPCGGNKLQGPHGLVYLPLLRITLLFQVPETTHMAPSLAVITSMSAKMHSISLISTL